MKSKFEKENQLLLKEQETELLYINNDHNNKLQNDQRTYIENMNAFKERKCNY